MKYEKIGIDLGHDTIKIVAFRGREETYAIKAMNIYQAKGSLLSNEYFNSLRSSIKEFLKINKIKKVAFSFTVAMSENVAISHNIKLPIMKAKYLKKSIDFELDDAGIAGNLRDYYYKSEILSTDKSENRHDILMLGIRKELVNQISKISSLKYKISQIELQPLTIGRMVEGSKLIIDYGQESTRIFYYENEKPTLIKLISIGGSDIDELIRKREGQISEEDLMRIKQQLIIHQNDNGNLKVIEDELKEIITDLTEEIRMYIRSIELEYDSYFESIYYLGGLSNLIGLKEYIASELSVDLKPLTIINVPGDSKLSNSENSLFFLAISVAMHQERPYFPSLQFSKLTKSQITYSPLFLGVLCSSLVLNFALMNISGIYDKNHEKLNSLLSTQSGIISSMESDLNMYENQIQRDKKYIDTINSMSGHNAWLSDILYVLSLETPEEVVVNNIEIKNGSAFIKGYAKDYSSIGFMVINLENYGNANIESVENEVQEEIYSQNKTLMSRSFVVKFDYDKSIRLIDDKLLETNDDFKRKK